MRNDDSACVYEHMGQNILETVRDRDLDPKDHHRKWPMPSRMVNVTNDITWACKVKVVTPCLVLIISKMAGDTDFVTMEHLYEIGHGESNGHVADDVACAGLLIRKLELIIYWHATSRNDKIALKIIYKIANIIKKLLLHVDIMKKCSK